jgi:hypothetical protein
VKQKLWIAWGVMAVTTVLVAIVTDSFAISEGFAIVCALFGWAAFLVRS